MKTTMLCTEVATPLPRVRTRLADYRELIKPRISVMVLLTVASGAFLAAGPALDWWLLAHTLAATAMVAIAANSWNQVLEKDTDARMRRTRDRPLPSGRMQPVDVMLFATALLMGGLLYLYAATRQPLAMLVALATFVSYVFLYTPLKRVTTLNTLIGAIPGALPPVIGWTAMRGSVGIEILVVFLVIFLWQVPHFLAIAWIYREDYGKAGLMMLPVVDANGMATSRQMLTYSMALLPTSLAPMLTQQVSVLYCVGVLTIGVAFFASTLFFAKRRSTRAARIVLRASLLYLPLFLAFLLLDASRP